MFVGNIPSAVTKPILPGSLTFSYILDPTFGTSNAVNYISGLAVYLGVDVNFIIYGSSFYCLASVYKWTNWAVVAFLHSWDNPSRSDAGVGNFCSYQFVFYTWWPFLCHKWGNWKCFFQVGVTVDHCPPMLSNNARY